MVIDVNSALLPSIGLHFAGSVPHLPHLFLCSPTYESKNLYLYMGFSLSFSESHVTMAVTVRHS